MLAGLCSNASEISDEEAIPAARAWLGLVDSGEFGRSWEQAAPFFREKVTTANWERAMKWVRAPLGAVESREFMPATAANLLPGAPEGEYEIVEFQTRFAKLSGAVETVTLMRTDTGGWKLAGYFIK
ncbi:MAG: DUF4019 domain-containing protein [Terrimicrobiaceae bacterium]|nr:DUF4019 domain-containing protein [Terrimicrobiaceae bacterium]